MKLDVEARVVRPGGFDLDAAISCEAPTVGIVGPSGSGKSTLLDAIAGIEPGARVVLDGDDVSRKPLHHRWVGYVTQDALLFPHLSVRANLLFSPRAGPLGEVPAALGIERLLDRMPRNLSGGERRRVALARAILSRPRLLLLDEPFAGLDEARRREAMSLLASLRERFRLPVILVSHVAEEIIGLAEWAVRLEAGRVVRAGPSASVLRAGETRIDNYLTGTVVGERRVRVDGVDLAAGIPSSASGEVRLACYAADIILAREPPRAISARNCFQAVVRSLTEAEEMIIVEVEPPRLRAVVTPEALRELAISPGSPVVVIAKATAFAHVGAA
ncbi:MAG TPA: ATP-binding cassette domain-containing protein [Kofleriaceae bacterium]|nr:ATP-binding cassette domain-containing protein [Kofleriaceae bacterium]